MYYKQKCNVFIKRRKPRGKMVNKILFRKKIIAQSKWISLINLTYIKLPAAAEAATLFNHLQQQKQLPASHCHIVSRQHCATAGPRRRAWRGSTYSL